MVLFEGEELEEDPVGKEDGFEVPEVDAVEMLLFMAIIRKAWRGQKYRKIC